MQILILRFQVFRKSTAIWKKSTIKPPFWPKKLLIQNIKSLNKEDLLLILRAYLEIDTSAANWN